MDTNAVEHVAPGCPRTKERICSPGANSGGRHWAIVATLIQTAKSNDVDPLAWLTDVLERIVSGHTSGMNYTACCHGLEKISVPRGQHRIASNQTWDWRHAYFPLDYGELKFGAKPFHALHLVSHCAKILYYCIPQLGWPNCADDCH